MTLSPEAVALLKSLINNPRAVEDGPILRELFEPRFAMGSPAKVHATARGRLYLDRLEKAD